MTKKESHVDRADRAVESAMQQVWAEYGNLIARKVSERSIAHRLAIYLEREYPGFHVDCEYNRSHKEPKTVMVFREDLPPRKLEELVKRIMKAEKIDRQTAEAVMHFRISPYPDIVVHERNNNSKNTVIIEVKYRDDERGEEGREYDRAKIKAFTDPKQKYKYKVGVFLEISETEANIEIYKEQECVIRPKVSTHEVGGVLSKEFWWRLGRKTGHSESDVVFCCNLLCSTP